MNNEQKIEEILTRGVDEAIIKEHLKGRLLKGEKMRVKFGIDPTSPDLHLGHTVPLRKLRQFQDLGHQIILLIGDHTAKIGDPSGRSETRKVLTDAQVQRNLKDYEKQAGKVLNMEKVEVRYNSEWYDKKNAIFLLELASKITVARAIERDDFKKRMKEDVDVSIMEVMYPLMQGYDSVELDADVEIGGTDQKFNLLTGRKIQRRYGKKEQDILTVPLLEGTDGVNKMSKSLGNYIGLTEAPNNMFSKIMSVPDSLIVKYFRLLTDVEEKPIIKMKDGMRTGKLNPRDAKLCLAHDIVKIYHGEEEAGKAQKYFIDTFSKREMPTDIPEVKIDKDSISLIDFMVLAKLATSKGDARRKIQQGGVSIESKGILELAIVDRPLNKDDDGKVVKVGKIHFVRVTF